MDLLLVVIGLIMLEYYIFILMAGMMRVKFGIQAPAMTGDPKFERMLRVQQNTGEQIILAIPCLYLFAHYHSELIAACLGLVFVIGRALYCVGYLKEPGKRSLGFIMGALANVIMLIGGLYGAISASLVSL